MTMTARRSSASTSCLFVATAIAILILHLEWAQSQQISIPEGSREKKSAWSRINPWEPDLPFNGNDTSISNDDDVTLNYMMQPSSLGQRMYEKLAKVPKIVPSRSNKFQTNKAHLFNMEEEALMKGASDANDTTVVTSHIGVENTATLRNEGSFSTNGANDTTTLSNESTYPRVENATLDTEAVLSNVTDSNSTMLSNSTR